MIARRPANDDPRTGRRAAILLAALGLAALALSACSTTQPRASERPRVAMTLSLQRTEVPAGATIPGLATLTNESHTTISVQACARDGWLEVGLTSPSSPYRPGNGAVACAPTVHLKPGPNRFSIRVATSYLACTPNRTAVSRHEELPRCVPGRMPALPAGHYLTSIVTSGLPLNTSMPAPLDVTLLPPVGAAWADEVFSAAAIPPGATTTSSALPTLRGAGTYLPDEVDVHRLFLVPGTRASVAAFILSHLPPGASNNQGITVQTDPVSYDAEFIPLTMPTEGPSENRATLSYAFAGDGPGVQELRIDALTSSVPTRPASEVVAPTGRVRVTGFGQSWLSGGTSDPVSVTLAGDKAEELRATFNRLGLGLSPECMEYVEGYTIAFFGDRSESPITATGSFCAGDDVSVATGERSGYGLSDPHCTLLEGVVRNLPPRAARATRNDLRECRLVYVG